METVISCTVKKHWEKDGKKLPIYEVEFSNGIIAESFNKEIPVNTDIEQCVFEDTQYGKKVKLKGQGGQKPYQKGKPQMQPSTMCLSYAKDLVIAGKIEFEQMLPSAEKMLNWVKKMEV